METVIVVCRSHMCCMTKGKTVTRGVHSRIGSADWILRGAMGLSEVIHRDHKLHHGIQATNASLQKARVRKLGVVISTLKRANSRSDPKKDRTVALKKSDRCSEDCMASEATVHE